ncbi:MAG: DUF2845 domain-containing protein [Curvibacter lanceolatus]|jgi:hypothetical protein|uniref:DUF2845 domain-containing protein n=1 Tax=Curvibacter lanceolatus TaxID=86182 RepID=UPI00036DCF59|nr:DUF2845 domain-containing protein [Curvibacter lanceolatus]MBV5293481.1 DUF2845 domain-containing protein [Curvibacter lanceolatus]
MKISAIFASALMAALPLVTAAQSLKCGNDFTQLGMSKLDVLQKCGQPLATDSFCKPADPARPPAQNAAAPCEKVEELLYNPGYGQFMTVLRFESGALKEVRYGDRAR